jgi:glycosyltransferase involved in cell wall biosynthesis
VAILVYTTQIRFPGGFENLAVSLAETLVTRGTRVFLLSHYSANFTIPGNTHPPRTIPSNIPVHYLNVSTTPSLWDVARAALRLRTLVKKLRIDAIEVSGGGPSVLAIIATVGLGTRIAVGIHDVVEKAGLIGIRRLWWRLVSRMLHRVKFFGVSHAASESWRRCMGLKEQDVATIYNSIEVRFFIPPTAEDQTLRDEAALAPAEKVILSAGRLMMRKGQDTVLEALHTALAEHHLHLVFVGRQDVEPGDDGTGVTQLFAKVNGSELLRQRVHFLGARNDMPALMASSDFLVHVPRKEAFGLVLAEAMAAGLPIIASNVGGIPEVLADTGSVLVPPEDPVALRQALVTCLEWAPTERQEIIHKGLKRAKAFHPDRRADQILALLQPTPRGG